MTLQGIRRPVEVSASPAGAFQQVAAARWEAKDQPEEELWRGGYSSKAMLGSWVISGCVSLALLLIGIIWVRDGYVLADSGAGDAAAVALLSGRLELPPDERSLRAEHAAVHP